MACPPEPPFDPYHKWLGIPPEEQPPNHYRLLGLRLFEDDRDVIDMAVAQRAVHLRTFQLGKHVALSQQLLKEVHLAKACLMDPKKKAAYDADLRARPPTPPASPAPRPGGPRRAIPPQVLLAAAGGAVVLLVLAIVLWWGTSREPFDSKAEMEPKKAGGVALLTGNPPPVQTEKPKTENPSSFIPHPSSLPPVPPPAATPFDAAKARQHQAAWAKYLGLPVETTNSIGMRFVLIPPGEFPMGSTPQEQAWAAELGRNETRKVLYLELVSSEGPQHPVKITQPFYLGLYEVTQAEYQQVMGANPSSFSGGESPLPKKPSAFSQMRRETIAKRMAGRDTSRYPVDSVSWDQAAEFCRKLSALPEEQKARRAYRLPSEAQWEYACRAGTTTRWSFGDDASALVDHAWFRPDIAHPGGQKKPNPWGLFDMYGNMGEWCADYFGQDYYRQSPLADPAGPGARLNHVIRGGAWAQEHYMCRSALRMRALTAFAADFTGFRVVCQLEAPKAP